MLKNDEVSKVLKHIFLAPIIAMCCISIAYAATYEDVMSSFAAGGATQAIGDKLWVPWFDTSSSCTTQDLHSGNACNAPTIDATHNCMVTDEYSQVGIWYALSSNTDRFDAWVRTLQAIQSTNGNLPSWRVYRDGDTIQPCRQGINSNCDTASDADARIIIALYTAHVRQARPTDELKTLADNLSRDFLKYEANNICLQSSVPGHIQICWWLAAGAGAKSGGLASTDYGYTGYYPDAIMAMLLACSSTGNETYCDAAHDFALNYLQAANFNNVTFTAPPGRSFKWTNLSGAPVAQCTNTCAPTQWDGADAPRALALCGVAAAAQQMHVNPLPDVLATYCSLWRQEHGQNSLQLPIQYTPSGDAAVAGYSSYWTHGLAAQFYQRWDEQRFLQALESATSHYRSGSWDNEACFGIYTKSPVVRVLGEASVNLNLFASLKEPTLNLVPPPEEPINNEGSLPANESFDGGSVELQEVPDLLGSFEQLEMLNAPQGGSYVAAYEKGDLQPIVVDGIGTAAAVVVENIDLIIIALVVGMLVALLPKIK